MHLQKERLGGDAVAGLEDDAVALQSIDGGKGQPLRRKHRPRPHGNDDRVGRQHLAVDDHAGDFLILLLDAGDGADAERRALRLRHAHHRGGEFFRMHLRGGLASAELSVEHDVAREPAGRRTAGRSGEGGAAKRVEAAEAPVDAALLGEFGMQREAASRERLQRRAVAPVEREEAAGLSRRGVGEAGALDDGRRDAATRKEKRNRGADDAAAADDDMHAAGLRSDQEKGNSAGSMSGTRAKAGGCRAWRTKQVISDHVISGFRACGSKFCDSRIRAAPCINRIFPPHWIIDLWPDNWAQSPRHCRAHVQIIFQISILSRLTARCPCGR